MAQLRHAIHSAYKAGAELVLPARSQSGFKESGEFVDSGDYLVRTCPTWSWYNNTRQAVLSCRLPQESGDASKAKVYLPKNKQYLITRNVPSNKRAAAVEQYGEKAEDGLRDEGDGWVSTPAELQSSEPATELSPPASSQMPAPAEPAARSTSDDDDIPDIDDLTLDSPPEAEDEAALSVSANHGGEEEDVILHTRTYDLMISYDKYYQVPRFWLVGYDESRRPLKPKEILEDVSEEHARKTITVDPFPHSSLVAASIHPCKHAAVMKKLATMAEMGGKEIRIDDYLIMFLKFIASVVPSIE